MGTSTVKDHWMEQRGDGDISVVDRRNYEMLPAQLTLRQRNSSPLEPDHDDVQNPNWIHGRLDAGSAGNGGSPDGGES